MPSPAALILKWSCWTGCSLICQQHSEILDSFSLSLSVHFLNERNCLIKGKLLSNLAFVDSQNCSSALKEILHAVSYL